MELLTFTLLSWSQIIAEGISLRSDLFIISVNFNSQVWHKALWDISGMDPINEALFAATTCKGLGVMMSQQTDSSFDFTWGKNCALALYVCLPSMVAEVYFTLIIRMF